MPGRVCVCVGVWVFLNACMCMCVWVPVDVGACGCVCVHACLSYYTDDHKIYLLYFLCMAMYLYLQTND